MSNQVRFKKSVFLIFTYLTLSIIGCSSDTAEQKEPEDKIQQSEELQPGEQEVPEQLTDIPYLERDVTEDEFYFVMSDRFHNGDVTNDEGSKYFLYRQVVLILHARVIIMVVILKDSRQS